jgi:hypothetical protein
MMGWQLKMMGWLPLAIKARIGIANRVSLSLSKAGNLGTSSLKSCNKIALNRDFGNKLLK